MIEKVAAWALGFVLIVPLSASTYLLLTEKMSVADYKSWWVPVLTALVAWIVKGK